MTEGDGEQQDHLVVDVLMDAAMDSVRMLPFLFAAFCLLEAMEKHAGNLSQRVLTGIRAQVLGGGAWLCAAVWIFRACSKFIFGRNDLGRNTARRIFIYLR